MRLGHDESSTGRATTAETFFFLLLFNHAVKDDDKGDRFGLRLSYLTPVLQTTLTLKTHKRLKKEKRPLKSQTVQNNARIFCVTIFIIFSFPSFSF